MTNKYTVIFAFIFMIVAILILNTSVATAAEKKDNWLMTIEILKSKLGDKDISVIDVRAGKDFSSSEFKIKGAMRQDPKSAEKWIRQYSKDKTYVLYCA